MRTDGRASIKAKTPRMTKIVDRYRVVRAVSCPAWGVSLFSGGGFEFGVTHD
jgi:hypothetical protein